MLLIKIARFLIERNRAIHCYILALNEGRFLSFVYAIFSRKVEMFIDTNGSVSYDNHLSGLCRRCENKH